MANYCYSTYRITGEASELDALYELMTRLEKEKENGNWVGHIVEALNDKIPEHPYVRDGGMNLKGKKTVSAFNLKAHGTQFMRHGISSAPNMKLCRHIL